jgi:hypothetical protein
MTYQGTTESEEGFMNISSPFIANAQAAKLVQPAQQTFDDPTGFTQAAAVRCALAGQAVSDAQAAEPAVMSATAIGAISLHDGRTLTWPADFSSQCGNGCHQEAQPLAVMHLSAAELNTQRNALGIGEEMMLTARFAAIRRVTACLEPAKTARALLESTTARDQSIRSAACNRRSNSFWSFSQTSAFCQSLSRRQQVMPLPQPSSRGKSSQAIPVRAARSQTRLRLGYFCRRTFSGMSGWMISHNESSINGFAIPRISPIYFKKYGHFVRRP